MMNDYREALRAAIAQLADALDLLTVGQDMRAVEIIEAQATHLAWLAVELREARKEAKR